MPDSYTAKLNLTKPEVGASTDTWGTKINSDLDSIDSLFDTGPYLKVSKGGTGAGTAADARTALGLGSLATKSAITSSDITDGTIIYSDIQNISATSRVLGRKSSGAGVTEELTLSDVLDFVGSAAHGDILYRGSSSWSRLAAGTSGQVLTSGGPAAAPTWSTIAPLEYLVFNASIGTSTTYEVKNTIITKAFKKLEIVVSTVEQNSGSNRTLQVQISGDNGATYSTAISVSRSMIDPISGVITIHAADLTSGARLVHANTAEDNNGTSLQLVVGSTTAVTGYINAIKLLWSGTGSFNAGTVTVIGYV